MGWPAELAGRSPMTTDSTVPGKSNAFRAIFWSGLVAGILDIGFVFVYFQTNFAVATRILQGIAGGVLGRETAIQGGLPTAALGLALHFVIAYGAAATFYAGSRFLPVLVKQPLISGPLYGVAVWLFMKGVVRLSALPPKPIFTPGWSWLPVFVAHLLCVGLPIAFIVRRCSR